jgi:aspartyl-tRNA(Asn)/glutamyl-tRNA(Gln) amidotransferase subunit A
VDFRRITVAEIAQHVATRSLSAREVVQAALERIDRYDDEIGAFVAVDDEAALAEASSLDARIASGEDVGALAGVPLAVKDLEDAAGFVTSRGSAAYAGSPPASSDSPLVERLRAAGCVVVGKTNTPEFGWKADTVNEVFGATRNPWSLGRFKPSLGRVPTGGREPPGWPMLSTRGVMTHRIRDAALALDSVVGPEPTDLVSLPLPDASWSRSLATLNPPRKVAWAPTLGYGRVDSEVLAVCESAVARLEELGTEVVMVDRLIDADPVQDWLALVGAASLRSLDKFQGDDAVWSHIDPGLVALLEWARSSVGPARVIEAIDACHTLNLALVDLFHGVSLLLSPTVAGQLPRVGEPGTINGDPDVNWVAYTYPFNMTRSPAGSVCAGFTADRMPVGLQVVGPQHGDVVVLRGLALLEDALALDTVAPFGGE